MMRWNKLVLFAGTASLSISAIAQVAPTDPIAPLPAPTTAAPADVPPPPPPPPVWQPAQVQALIAYIGGVGREGLTPADYNPGALEAALRGGDPVALSAAATSSFNKLSSDIALGHVRGDARIGWHIVDKDIDATRQRMLLDRALYDNRIAEALNGLLPSHPQYGALRTALQVTPKDQTAKVNRIRLNMDRWRWLPRDLGQKYIIVNVPSFHATLVENGATRWKRKAIAGAIKTPTPQLSVMATGVILNPSWEVPKSIWPEVAGKSGFVAIKDKNGKFVRWSQPPGPSNALGQLKFVMYNPYNIYLHDTNARSRFNSQVRALSHGCVRTEDVLDLATELLGDDGGEWTTDRIADTLASKKSKQANFVKPVPVHIVYFSAAALTDGTITEYQDLYKRDAKVIAALLDNDGKAPGAAPAKKVASN
ncbi:L,D-transpeptidase family protein [Sphingomonas sp. LY160]|uniref:L,D-transpeptidase family protein n=2 Tax=unclassified Sphingomonas TaxID=196159 RepID=UPI002ADEB381|nr:L,D-transpeptidase family protein [Sphingomonas sp. LY160]MEA1072237.1 L,D-transpeptidase family protein [Sphingomonas sp. LY160]